MSCSRLSVNEPVTLIHNPLFGYQWNELTILQSGKLPTMFIDVKSGNMDYIHKEKGNKEIRNPAACVCTPRTAN